MAMGVSGMHLNQLLDKMTCGDKDFRFMAVNDLMCELNRDAIQLDADSERKVVTMLLTLLQDKNIEVQNLSVKCLAPLIIRVKDKHLDLITDKLCCHLVSNEEQLRDIASIGLKSLINVIQQVSASQAIDLIVFKVAHHLTTAISKDDVFIKMEALDIFSSLINKFGSTLITSHAGILHVLKPCLFHSRLAIRKKAINALGCLVMACNDKLFSELVQYLLDNLNKASDIASVSSCVQCISTISKHAGHKIGPHIETILPFIVKFCRIEEESENHELREYCLQTLECFVIRCPKYISQHIDLIVTICKECINYDPNYNYDCEGDQDMDDDDLELDDDSSEEDVYSDDDDISWKVRRAAAKTLQSLVMSRQDLLQQFHESLSSVLILSFREREENVKSDIFNVYLALLKQTKQISSSYICDQTRICEINPYVNNISREIGSIVNSTYRYLRLKPVKPRMSTLALLSDICSILPNCLSPHIAVLMPGLIFSLTEKSSNSNIKIDTLHFLDVLLSTHESQIFTCYIQQIGAALCCNIDDTFYKVSSEALVVTERLIDVIRRVKPSNSGCNDDCSPAAPPMPQTLAPLVSDLYKAAEKKLKLSEIDQEIKEHAISCVGKLIHSFGDYLNAELASCLPILLDRLHNEITRYASVKALSLIARSPLKVDITPILKDTVPILASFLRKNQRSLRLSSVLCLDNLVQNYGKYMDSNMFAVIIKELSPLLSESDLHISQLTLNLLTSICKRQPTAIDLGSREAILPQTLNLLLSPLLQGDALVSLSQFYQALSLSGLESMSFVQLRQYITSSIDQANNKVIFVIHKQAFQSIAKCLAQMMLVISTGHSACITGFINCIQNAHMTESQRLLSILTIAEFGYQVDLNNYSELQKILIDLFSSKYEEIKTAAAYAIGRITVSNMSASLPLLMQSLSVHSKHQYLLLHSLKETISCALEIKTDMDAYIPMVWDLLLKYSSCTEEGTRNVVSECLGTLCIAKPQLITRLAEYLSNATPLEKATIVTSVKFTISDQHRDLDPILRECMPSFLALLKDADLTVRRSTLISLNSTVHNKPSLIRSLLNNVLPDLYTETTIRKDLIREVEMGPFKHTVDDGLDIRKAAFECMYTLLETCRAQIDIHDYMNQVLWGLADHYDIKMLTHLMLIRVVHLCPDVIIQFLDKIVEALLITCSHKVKQNSVKQEYEKQEELKRSALRAFNAVLKVQSSTKNIHVKEFVDTIKKTPELNIMWENIAKDCVKVNTPCSSEGTVDAGGVKNARYQ